MISGKTMRECVPETKNGKRSTYMANKNMTIIKRLCDVLYKKNVIMM